MMKKSVFIVATALIAACSSVPNRPEVITYSAGFPAQARSGEETLSWSAIRFRIPYGPEDHINWEMDLLLAHNVLGPLIADNLENLPLWRFHRRAGDDWTGHQLSLIFYSDAPTANSLFLSLDGNPILEAIQQEGKLTQIRKQVEPYQNSESISGTSDEHWHPAIQRQWPMFIMGVSATWLGLIDEMLPDAHEEKETVDQTLARYAVANERLTKLWRDQGQHAFLHHLSALFGYEPLLIRKEIRF